MVVARIDPKTWKAQEVIRYPANERFFSSTVALQVGKEIWLGTINGDRETTTSQAGAKVRAET